MLGVDLADRLERELWRCIRGGAHRGGHSSTLTPAEHSAIWVEDWVGVATNGRISGDGFWSFEATTARRLSVSCAIDEQPLLEDVISLSVIEPSDTVVVAGAAHDLPVFADRTGHVRSELVWPSEHAVADRIDRVVSSIDLTGLALDVLAVEHWGHVRRLIAVAPEAEEVLQHHRPRWWSFEIDAGGGTER